MSLVLLNQFKGAIAGATLGYLIGNWYQTHYPEQQDNQPSIFPVLDLHWLHKAISQLTGQQTQHPSHRFPIVLFSSIHSQSGHTTNHPNPSIDLTPSNHACMAMFEELNHVHQYSKRTPRFLISPTYVAHTPLQAAFTLIPRLLLFYDDKAKQQTMIEHTLVNWIGSNDWGNEVRAIGLMLSSAITTQVSPCSYTTSLPVLSPVKLICDLFSHTPNSYNTGIMALVHQILNDINGINMRNGDDLALITGLIGASFGSYSGFSGLPLCWRHLLCSDIFKEPYWMHFQKKLLNWSTQLAASWCGVTHLTQEGKSLSTVPTAGVSHTSTRFS